MITFGTVASGIETASLAWDPLGWRAVWFAETDPFASAVIEHHWPGPPNLGDLQEIEQQIRTREIPAPAVFAGGTPCQAFSVSGKRLSLADPRGNLSLSFIGAANAIDDIRRDRGEPPAAVLWENVPGALSTDDNFFGHFLGELCGSGAAIEAPPGRQWTGAGLVSGPRRAVAWRTLDAQYFGLAQRRRRVFVVASAAGGPDPAAVLFEHESDRRDRAPGDQARNGLARTGNRRDLRTSGAQNAKIRILGGGPEGKLISHALSARDAKGTCSNLAQATIIIDERGDARRMTPLERERLQGIPDNYTRIPWKGRKAEKCPDGPRIKTTGNAWAVPVVRWIGERLDREIRRVTEDLAPPGATARKA